MGGATFGGSERPGRQSRRVLGGAARLVAPAGLLWALAGPAGAWFPGLVQPPTAVQARANGVDFAVSTHQWLAGQGMRILAANGHEDIARFLAQPDPSAPQALDPADGHPLGRPEPYAWRVLTGARDADGVLHPQLRDHLHNFWTHRGRQWIIGGSAAANAEEAFARAVTWWRQGNRAQAMYWLGASLHLVDDACVPQHNFFGVGVYHRDYERWMLTRQDALAVGSGGILSARRRARVG